MERNRGNGMSMQEERKKNSETFDATSLQEIRRRPTHRPVDRSGASVAAIGGGVSASTSDPSTSSVSKGSSKGVGKGYNNSNYSSVGGKGQPQYSSTPGYRQYQPQHLSRETSSNYQRRPRSGKGGKGKGEFFGGGGTSRTGVANT